MTLQEQVNHAVTGMLSVYELDAMAAIGWTTPVSGDAVALHRDSTDTMRRIIGHTNNDSEA